MWWMQVPEKHLKIHLLICFLYIPFRIVAMLNLLVRDFSSMLILDLIFQEYGYISTWQLQVMWSVNFALQYYYNEATDKFFEMKPILT